ncbi:tyrosine-type recombinase/integrase [bacterium]|nr:tyrosine-type recombinase/integrase [bacterium]
MSFDRYKPAKKGKRKPFRIPTFLELDEYTKLLEQPDVKRAKSGLRNLLMMRLMGECGLRLSEMLSLHPAEINWRSGQTKIHGKGSKERFVVINPDLLQKLEELGKDKPFFLSRTGKRPDPSYVHAMVVRYGQRAKIPKKVHPHTLRHTFATQYLREFHDLASLQRILGHANMNSTMIYLHASDSAIEKTMRNIDWGRDK